VISAAFIPMFEKPILPLFAMSALKSVAWLFTLCRRDFRTI
jgi:hypothetical protein